jgi:hypothetical protein
MARGTPTYFSGTITGTNNVEDLVTQLETRIKAYQSNATDAWEEWDVVTATAGSRDIVYRSIGDRTLTGGGDASLFLRLTQTAATTIRIRGYQDWSTVSSTGHNEAGSTATTNGSWTALDATTDIDYFGVSNEYEFAFVMIQGGVIRGMFFGSPKRTHIPPAGDGIAYTSNAETAGASVVIEVDRDITANITVGQKIWVYNRTPTATALRADNINIGTVDAKAAGSITIDTLDNNIEAGAIIGLDPSPMYVTTCLLALGSLYFTHHAGGTYEGIASNVGQIEPMVELLTEATLDPHNATGLYHGSEAILDDDDPVNGGSRGTPELMTWWPIGTQANADRMIPNYDTAQAYKVFPSILNGSFCLAIGPGATA